jgi:hypothetical protein
MQPKKLIGSLVLALSLVSGPAFAASIEPVPEKDLDPVINKEAKIVPATLDLAFQEPRPESEEKPDEGFLPELPILLDGKLYSAEELQEAGVHLSDYVLDTSSAEMNVLQGFRSPEQMKVYLEKTGQMPSEQPSDRQLLCPYSHFYEHSWYGGARFSVYPGQAVANLGWFWNDRISSVWSSVCASWTVLYEHPNFGGHRLWLGRNWAIPHVGAFGWLGWSGWFPRWYNWNDRASSVIVFW